MRNLRSYYSASIAEFLRQSISEIIGIVHSNDISAETTIRPGNASGMTGFMDIWKKLESKKYNAIDKAIADLFPKWHFKTNSILVIYVPIMKS